MLEHSIEGKAKIVKGRCPEAQDSGLSYLSKNVVHCEKFL